MKVPFDVERDARIGICWWDGQLTSQEDVEANPGFPWGAP